MSVMRTESGSMVGAVAAERPRLSLRARRVVRELRQRREALGWTLDEAASHSGLSPATISRTENGESLRAPNVTALLTAYGAEGADVQALLALTRQANKQGWWTGIDEAVMSPPYQDLAELEEEASWKRSFEPLMIPGLLQTPRYAAISLAATAPQLTEEQRAEKVEIRMKRQGRLGRFEFTAVLLEEVLRRPAGTPSVMKEQLGRLVEASLAGHVELRVLSVPAGMHPGIMGAFSFLGGFTPVDAVVAYAETAFGDACYEDDATTTLITDRFRRLLDLTKNPDESRRLVEKIRGSG